jgi:hypothetical protein
MSEHEEEPTELTDGALPALVASHREREDIPSSSPT